MIKFTCIVQSCTQQAYARGMCCDCYIIYWEGRKKIMKEESYKAGRGVTSVSIGGAEVTKEIKDTEPESIFDEERFHLAKIKNIKQLEWKQKGHIIEANGVNCIYYIECYLNTNVKVANYAVIKSIFGSGCIPPVRFNDVGEARDHCQQDFEAEVKNKYLEVGNVSKNKK